MPDLPAEEIVEELRAQAALAADAGFDGVMTSEHHGGFPGYLPNPLLAAGWCLEAMPRGWAAPCPLLLPLRATTHVAEDVAWLAARFPGRVGVGVAAGALEADFTLAGQSMDGLTRDSRVGSRSSRGSSAVVSSAGSAMTRRCAPASSIRCRSSARPWGSLRSGARRG